MSNSGPKLWDVETARIVYEAALTTAEDDAELEKKLRLIGPAGALALVHYGIASANPEMSEAAGAAKNILDARFDGLYEPSRDEAVRNYRGSSPFTRRYQSDIRSNATQIHWRSSMNALKQTITAEELNSLTSRSE